MAQYVDLDDPADPRLADYRDLRDVELRKHLETEQGLFIAEGEKVVRRAVEAGHAPRSFLMARRWLDGLDDVLSRSDAPCYVVDESLAEQVTGFHVHRGALASMHRTPMRSVHELLDVSSTTSRIAVLEDVVDHANVGAAFRSAAALGLDAVLVTPRCADPLYRRSVKVSMGTVFQVPWTRVDPWPEGIDQLRALGYVVAALTLADDAITLDELSASAPPKLAVVMGTEGHGILPATAQLADVRVRIPMAGGVDSLNVAAAAAVAFYATRRADSSAGA